MREKSTSVCSTISLLSEKRILNLKFSQFSLRKPNRVLMRDFMCFAYPSLLDANDGCCCALVLISLASFALFTENDDDEEEDDDDDEDDDEDDEDDDEEGGVKLRLEDDVLPAAVMSAGVTATPVLAGVVGVGGASGVGLTFSKKLKSLRSGKSI